MTTLQFPKSTGWSHLRLGFLLIPLALGCFGLSPAVRAVDPPPDGGYPGRNTAEGDNALFSLTTGQFNTALGFQALFNNATGWYNTATGYQALVSNTTGLINTATGVFALEGNTTGVRNTANGAAALASNKTGNDNTATGVDALVFNTTGINNTANGGSALFRNTTASNNTASGYQALFSNTTGGGNTANGSNALLSNTTGARNTANGAGALQTNTTGFNNTANGGNALFGNTTGSNNTANGIGALRNSTTGKGNTANGGNALFNNTGSFNMALGYNAGGNLTTGSNNIDIGNPGVAGESNTTRIGTVGKSIATFIAGIRETTTANANAVPVVIDSAGQLGTVGSSRRFKDEIKPMDNSSEAILGLKPVTFHYKSDSKETSQFGLIAEDVAKVNPELVVRDDAGEIYTVRYEAVNAMLLNEFLKEHGQVQQLKTTVAQQQKQIEALTATVRKVSERVELSASAPQIAANED